MKKSWFYMLFHCGNVGRNVRLHGRDPSFIPLSSMTAGDM